MAGIAQIQGVAPATVMKLAEVGVRSLSDLRAAGESPDGLRTLVDATGSPESQVASWVVSAELMRVSGVGPSYAGLLQAAGVRSLQDLAYSRPRDLSNRLTEAGSDAGTPVPNPRSIALWIAAAHELLHRSFSKDPEVVEI